MVSVDAVMDYLGAGESDREFVAVCVATATTLVDAYVGATSVPEDIMDAATTQTASEMFHRKSAPSGVAQFSSLDGISPIRVAKDPMTSVYPMLNRWVVLGV